MGRRQGLNTCHSTADLGELFPHIPSIRYLQRNTDMKDRICLGQQFALTEAGYVMVRLLQRFDKVDNSAMAGKGDEWYLTLTGRPLHGVKMKFHEAVEN